MLKMFMLSSRRKDYRLTEGTVSVNKQWLPNGAFFTLAVLSSEKVKSERKPDSEHIHGLHEEDSMDCQSSKENLS